MIKKKLIMGICLTSLIISLYISVSTVFITLLLGLLFLPPALVLGTVIMDGTLLVLKKVRALTSSKGFFVISISKENITLEPQFR